MGWWNDLWLNEGFASWMEFKGVEAIDKKFDVWDSFIPGNVQTAMRIDSTEGATHALHQKRAVVRSTQAIEELFDSIDYDKGASVIRMVSSYMDRAFGDGTWKECITRYLQSHKYSNARSSDLWEAVSAKTKTNFGVKMAQWTQGEGYPVVRIRRSQNSRMVQLSQERFFISSGVSSTSTWWIPLTICSGHTNGFAEGCKRESIFEFETATKTIELPHDVDGACIKANVGTLGFYRVLYDPEDWQCLRRFFFHLSPGDRSGLVDDAFTLAFAGQFNYSEALPFVPLLQNESALLTWSPALFHINDISVRLFDQAESCKKGLKWSVNNAITPMVELLGFNASNEEAPSRAVLRSKLLAAAIKFSKSSTVTTARRLFEHRETLDPNIAAVVYSAVVQHGTRKDFDAIMNLYLETDFAAEKRRLRDALCMASTEQELQEVLQMSLIDEKVRSQDTCSVIYRVSRSSNVGLHAAWKFMQKNWDVLFRRYGSGGFAFSTLMSVPAAFTTQEMRNEVEKSFVDHPAPAGEKELRATLEAIDATISWISSNAMRVCAWLEGG